MEDTSDRSHIERNITRLDSEVMMVKSAITNVSSELHSLKGDMIKGFEAQAKAMREQGVTLSNALKEQANAKPRLGLDNLVALLGIGSMFCAVFWMIISQRIDPLKEAISEGFRRADHESILRDELQKMQIEKNTKDVSALEDRQIQILMSQSASQAKHDALQRICEELHDKLEKKP